MFCHFLKKNHLILTNQVNKSKIFGLEFFNLRNGQNLSLAIANKKYWLSGNHKSCRKK